MGDVSVSKNFQAAGNTNDFTVKMCFTGINRDYFVKNNPVTGEKSKNYALKCDGFESKYDGRAWKYDGSGWK
ncbi:MAG: hypothetical protein GY757_19515 [bacterium]|nr:hypothetical protein [bacterium]